MGEQVRDKLPTATNQIWPRFLIEGNSALMAAGPEKSLTAAQKIFKDGSFRTKEFSTSDN